MNCLNCSTKECKLNQKDCNANRSGAIEIYQQGDASSLYRDADALVAGGRAGTLSRLDELIEFCTTRGYQKIGLAYCYGMEDLAQEVLQRMKASGLTMRSYRCTINGVREQEIHSDLGSSTGCNPVGQVLAIHGEKVDFVVEMGLCLGHDVLFHRELRIPFTVLIVKDRVWRHNPALALDAYRDGGANFLENIDDKFAMAQPDTVEEKLKGEEGSIVADVRATEAYESGHIAGSINIPLRQLPARWKELAAVHSKNNCSIYCVCGGGIQSAYAVMFLRSRGLKNTFNLSGGIGRWQKEGRPFVS